MKIIDDVKLDFDDVLLCPQPSFLSSRSEVCLERIFKFKHSNQTLQCIPIAAANMASVSGYNMARAMASHNMLTAFPKDVDFFSEENDYPDLAFLTVGTEESSIYDLPYSPSIICVDVANGYMDKLYKFVSKVRETHSDAIIIAGNVCTPNAVERLIFNGADIVKVGIGGGSGCTTRLKTGCFVAGTLVNTINGLKPIESIDLEDTVLSHDGTYQKVTNTHQLESKDNLVEINGIRCTSNHEFYVIKKKDAEKVNEKNIHDYAMWIEAKNLSEKYLVIEIDK